MVFLEEREPSAPARVLQDPPPSDLVPLVRINQSYVPT